MFFSLRNVNCSFCIVNGFLRMRCCSCFVYGSSIRYVYVVLDIIVSVFSVEFVMFEVIIILFKYFWELSKYCLVWMLLMIWWNCSIFVKAVSSFWMVLLVVIVLLYESCLILIDKFVNYSCKFLFFVFLFNLVVLLKYVLSFFIRFSVLCLYFFYSSCLSFKSEV